jgi:hypothetical protein
VPPGNRSRLELAGGAATGDPSTKLLTASPQPTASIGVPPTTRNTIDPPVAASPPLYKASDVAANTPALFATSTRRPGSRAVGEVHVALRVTVLPEAVT